MLLRPLLGLGLELLHVIPEPIRKRWHERILRIWFSYQHLQAGQDAGDVDGGLPRAMRRHLQDVQADTTSCVHVGVVDGVDKPQLGRPERVPFSIRDRDLQLSSNPSPQASSPPYLQ